MESGVSYRDPFNYGDRGQSAPPGDQLLDLICDEISEMYRSRWAIEIFY